MPSPQILDETQKGGYDGSYAMEHDPFSSSLPYPFLFVYETHEQALAESERRKRLKESFEIPPLPT
jgi:hypothetical protein